MEPIHRLVAPQHLGRQVHEFLIQPGRLPIPTAMRLQTRPGQNMGHGRKVDRGNEPLFLHHLLQRFVLFPGQEFEEPGLAGQAGTQAARRARSTILRAEMRRKPRIMTRIAAFVPRRDHLPWGQRTCLRSQSTVN